MNGRREAAMDAEDLIVDNDAQRQEIKHVSEIMPNVRVTVFAGAFGIEAIGLCYPPRLMVPADQVYSVRVS
jgi:hypothetical protein